MCVVQEDQKEAKGNSKMNVKREAESLPFGFLIATAHNLAFRC